MKTRPPIVVIVGHIDHGKTTLLDYIRKTNVAGREAGNITQSIGAYEIEYPSTDSGQVRRITFIDTPGHEAFSHMRAHGVKGADLAILVVAADDGVKPQTKDVLTHIREAGIPFVVAINKIDLEAADVEKTKQGLIQAGVLLEGVGGDVSYQLISALKGDGIKELLDLIILVADVEKLTYNPKASGQGVVLNSFRDAQKGIIVGAVIKNGVLCVGDAVYTPTANGKIRSLKDFSGNTVKRLEPSSPALIFGFSELPNIGELIAVGESRAEPQAVTIPEEKAETISKEEECVKLILKADETGSLEALQGIINKISSDELPLYVVKTGVGNIYENDVKFADSTGADIIGFHIKADKAALNLAKARHIVIITSPIIYKLEEELRKHLAEIAPKEERIIEILAVFGLPKGKEQIIGGKVIKGFVKNQELFSIVHDGKTIGSGKILNLQSQKEDIQQAEEEQEVGLLVESDKAIKKGCQLLFV